MPQISLAMPEGQGARQGGQGGSPSGSGAAAAAGSPGANRELKLDELSKFFHLPVPTTATTPLNPRVGSFF